MAAAQDLQRLVLTLEARLSKYEKDMARARRTTDQATRQIEQRAQRSMRGVSQTFANAGRQIAASFGPALLGALGPIAGAGVGIAGLGIAANRALDAFQKFEVAQLTTQQVLRATGDASGRTGEQIEQLARDIGFGTLASTQGVREAANQLLTFRSISGETFDRTLRLAQDLATVGFGTLESSTVQLAKALEDPVAGLTALRRVGVSFSASQRAVIKELAETGRVAEAQRKILEAVEQQVGGAGLAAGGGLAGAYDGLSEEVAQFTIRTGEQIAALLQLQDVIAGITSVIRRGNILAAGGRPAAQIRFDETRGQIEGLREEIALLERVAPGDSSLPRLREQVAGLEEQARAYGDAIQILRRAEQQRDVVNSENAAAAREEARVATIEGVTSALDEEIAATRRSALENRILQEQRAAGVDAASAEGQAIADRVRLLFQEAEARKAAAGGGGGKKDGFAGAVAQVEERIAAQRLEAEALRLTATEADKLRVTEELLAAAREDGIATTPELKAQIESLAGAYANAAEAARQVEERAKAATEAADFFGETAASSVADLILEGKSAEEVFANLAKTIAKAALEAALLGKGPFGAGFGGKGGGIFGAIASAFVPGRAGGGPLNLGAVAAAPRATGGPVRPGVAYDVGEFGKERFVPTVPGRIIPADKVGGSTYAPVYQIDARGADVAAVARLERALAERDRQFGRNVMAVTGRVQTRNTRA